MVDADEHYQPKSHVDVTTKQKVYKLIYRSEAFPCCFGRPSHIAFYQPNLRQGEVEQLGFVHPASHFTGQTCHGDSSAFRDESSHWRRNHELVQAIKLACIVSQLYSSDFLSHAG